MGRIQIQALFADHLAIVYVLRQLLPTRLTVGAVGLVARLMSNLFWLTDEQMAGLQPYFPKSHGRQALMTDAF